MWLFQYLSCEGYAFEAVLWAAINVISIAYENGWHRLWLESDSSLVISLLSFKSLKIPWRMRNSKRMDFRFSRVS